MRLLTIIFVLSFFVSAEATKHYVDSDASGGNDGTSWTDAWEHADSINGQAKYDTFWVAGIHYDVQIQPDTGWHIYGGNGTDNTITHGGGTLVGGKEITGWTSYAGNVYKAPWTQTTGDVFGSNLCYTMIQIDTINDDTLWMYRQSTLVAVDAESEYFQNAANDSFYVYVTDTNSVGLDPADYQLYASSKIIINCGDNGYNQKHMYMEGLHVKLARAKAIYTGGDNNHIDSCTFRAINAGWVATNTSQNAGCFGAGNIADSSDGYGHHNRWVHDTANHVNEVISGGHHANGFIFYGESYAVIESCVVFSDVSVGYQFKGHAAQTQDDIETGNVIRYNVLHGAANVDAGVMHSANFFKDSVYGNIFISSGAGIYYKAHDYYGYGDSSVIYSNTFVNCDYGVIVGSEGYIGGRVDIKYNVFYECDADGAGSNNANIVISCTGSSHGWPTNSNDTLVFPDSNIYYDASAQSWALRSSSSNYTSLTTWQAAGDYDANSNTDDPVFDDIDAADPWLGLARTGVSQWDVPITYGGRIWYMPGAVQPAAASIITPATMTGSASMGGNAKME